MGEEQSIDKRTIQERFTQDFTQALKSGNAEAMALSLINASVTLTDIPDNWGREGSANYDNLLEHMKGIINEYNDFGDVQGSLYLGDMGSSRILIYYDGENLDAEPTKQSDGEVIRRWYSQPQS